MPKENKYNVGDEVYHSGYLCTGVIKDTVKVEAIGVRYLVDWKQAPLKNTNIYFSDEYLESPDFKYYILKANNTYLPEKIKKFRKEVKKQSPQRMSIFSSEGGKIIQK